MMFNKGCFDCSLHLNQFIAQQVVTFSLTGQLEVPVSTYSMSMNSYHGIVDALTFMCDVPLHK